MFGQLPSPENRLSWPLQHQSEGAHLKPLHTWKAMVGQLRPVAADESVGYGRMCTLRGLGQLAVIPIGYADGYSRALGSRTTVLIRGCSALAVGWVCTNILVADVTDIPGIVVGDGLVLIGRQGEDEVPPEEIASSSDTINPDFFIRSLRSTPRVVV